MGYVGYMRLEMVFLGFGGYNHQNPAWAFADAVR